MVNPPVRHCGSPVALLLALVVAGAPAEAQEVFLVEDIDSTAPPAGTVTASGNQFVAFQGALYFNGCDATSGCELWKTDGTPGGTEAVADLNAGTASSNPSGFLVVGSTLYFVATSAATGSELWKSDGTGPGTGLVEDIRAGATGSSPSLLTAVGSTLYFRANDGTNGTELWKSDGTEPGTAMVANLNPGSASSSPIHLAPFGSSLLFIANDGSTGNEPWISDGTAPGTVRLADVRPGTSSGATTSSSGGPHFATLGAAAFLGANDGNGWALWTTDGTPGGTAELADFGPNGSGDTVLGARTIGGKVFVAVYDAITGAESGEGALWVSDGSAPNTIQIASFETALDRKGTLSVPVELGGAAYFIGATRDLGAELWTSDGTALGTTLVGEIWPGAASGVGRILPTGSGLLVAAYHPEAGYEAWFSDGSGGGTFLVRDAYPGPANGGATFFNGTPIPGELGGKVYLTAPGEDPAFNVLLETDGTPGGDAEVFAIGAPTASGGHPAELARFGTSVLFSARDGANGREPWISDKSPEGTFLLADLAAGAAGSDPRYFAQVGGMALFSAWTPATGRELFVTDGTPGGTGLLVDIEPGAGSSNPAELVTYGSAVLFRACDAAGGCELWKSDGTAPGTARLVDLVAGPGGSFPERFTLGAGKVFFRATTPGSGTELWVTDGTPGGTSQPAEIGVGSASSLPQDLEGTATRAFFFADDGSHGLEAWTSDGTPGGTILTTDVAAGERDGAYASDDYAAAHQGSYYWVLPWSDDTGTNQLWKSDGTPGGTTMVADAADIDPPFGGGFQWPASGGDFLWLSFYFASGNWEPFRTDGTPGGTILVQELNPGTAQSQPYGFVGYEGNAYFMATGPDGRRLWRGTGYPGETVPLGPTGAAAVTPIVLPPYFSLVEAGGTLFFVGSTSAEGRELFAYGLPIFVTGFEGEDLEAVWDLVVGGAP